MRSVRAGAGVGIRRWCVQRQAAAKATAKAVNGAWKRSFWSMPEQSTLIPIPEGIKEPNYARTGEVNTHMSHECTTCVEGNAVCLRRVRLDGYSRAPGECRRLLCLKLAFCIDLCTGFASPDRAVLRCVSARRRSPHRRAARSCCNCCGCPGVCRTASEDRCAHRRY